MQTPIPLDSRPTRCTGGYFALLGYVSEGTDFSNGLNPNDGSALDPAAEVWSMTNIGTPTQSPGAAPSKPKAANFYSQIAPNWAALWTTSVTPLLHTPSNPNAIAGYGSQEWNLGNGLIAYTGLSGSGELDARCVH